jgi:DNA-binding NarL/FixJ family response regulator
MKIVIVDDEESMRAVLRTLVKSQGHEVVAEFADGKGLIDYVVQHHPDVVCLDFNLPGENGLDLLRHMDVKANHVDVVMISGAEDPDLMGKAADAGATGFLHKPLAQSQIIKELKDIEETRRIAAQAAKTAMPPQVKADAVELAVSAPPATAAVVPAPPAKPMPPPAVIPRTAVVVDDSGSVRLLLKGILEGMGIKVLGFAASGADGVEAVKKLHPALVCLDIDMPGMSGLEALPLMHEALPAAKIIMITGNAGRSIVEAAVAGGAKGYFLKPIRPAKVEEFIGKLFSR